MKQQKIKWEKFASVTGGGKPYFWRGNAIGSSIVWNRHNKQYHASLFGKSLGLFNNVNEAKRIVQNVFDESKISCYKLTKIFLNNSFGLAF